ncbi:3-phosphoshikimate 1-carboxyvinyltransferase [Psychroserpens burtonensis]|uniref:3-phosphoshikimate 1-carboxyvinyltransferase n=1 Tax=Psychroserpens burtonensis TaxID=49278 RepID=A0A5C7B6U9_9FLAO|nr:3-phosphoshikimate 1-carboxyvinyltransferase [Psychroserpens burtonensis]TXE17622.1 3-phosphoshikimate 1-carboxyvinyltransferase [Psychroserpens burtonensis]
MTIQLHKSVIKEQSNITITGSKSESNRLLLLQALYPELKINNVSNSDDSIVMQKALTSKETTLDIHHAGTAMRFLTAYFASKEGRNVALTGSSRMKERPIEILVDALHQLGAEISYTEAYGCPPIRIQGKKLTKHKVTLKANVSSQYISALLLIASRLENGLELTLEGKITSIPYINMTLDLLNQVGIQTTFENQVIKVNSKKDALKTESLTVESDWSSASYFYSIVALSPIGTEVKLTSYKEESLQGDSVLAHIYIAFGVKTVFGGDSILLKKVEDSKSNTVEFQLNNSPDIAQTIAVTCLGLGLKCHLTGLHTLKIKETDRLVALQNELQKLGATIDITEDTLTLHKTVTLNKNVAIATYNDHRMAMAFAPLALKTDVIIEDYRVVSKSYPTFWDDLKTLGFKFSK